MPLYHILHATPLTVPQKDELAVAITHIHSTRFTTPKNFVNVDYRDVSKDETYVGGKRHIGNHIHANVRTGPARTQADWDALCLDVQAAWDKIVGEGLPAPKGTTHHDTKLRSVIILGGMTAGLEAGFLLPPAGGDVQWMKDNWEEFNRRADAGDEEMKGMVQEIQERGLMEQEANGIKNAVKKLEDMLGWGEAA